MYIFRLRFRSCLILCLYTQNSTCILTLYSKRSKVDFCRKRYPIKIQSFSHKPPFCSLVKFFLGIYKIYSGWFAKHTHPIFLINLLKFWFWNFQIIYLYSKTTFSNYWIFLYYLWTVFCGDTNFCFSIIGTQFFYCKLFVGFYFEDIDVPI